jgi:hypothetical protein
MEKGEPRNDCHEQPQDIARTLAAFWGNQLERIKQRVEKQVSRASTYSKSDGKFQGEPGISNRT